MVRGRWSMVDWFDSDERRYVLAVPNQPSVTDPRGLTERENQVVGAAVLGHSNKMIAYRLGLSTSRVSTLLRSAMRKLGFRTRNELVSHMSDFQALD
jgi:DNA-binding NarL/FixJ family response regulator